jgi:hypothetical protein
MGRASARCARALVVSAIPVSVRWICIARLATHAKVQATVVLAEAPGSGDGSRAVQTLWGGTLKIDATNEENR